MLLYKLVDHPDLQLCVVWLSPQMNALGLEVAQRIGGASLQGATEQMRGLQLQKQWLAAGMTGLQSHTGPEKLDQNELLAAPAWELEAINDGTKYTPDNRMWFLEISCFYRIVQLFVDEERAWIHT